jgi:hypothetical protein
MREKGRATLERLYGVDNVAKSMVVQDRMKTTMRERYGVENPQQSKEIREKARHTNIERRAWIIRRRMIPSRRRNGRRILLGGVEVQAKVRNTNLER